MAPATARVKFVGRQDLILRERAGAEIIVAGIALLHLTGVMQASPQLQGLVLCDVIAGSRRAFEDGLSKFCGENSTSQIPCSMISLNHGTSGIHHCHAAEVSAMTRNGVLL